MSLNSISILARKRKIAEQTDEVDEHWSSGDEAEALSETSDSRSSSASSRSLLPKETRRQMSNRAASQRSRDKKRRTIETLSERVAELEARNAELVQHLQLLQNHIQNPSVHHSSRPILPISTPAISLPSSTLSPSYSWTPVAPQSQTTITTVAPTDAVATANVTAEFAQFESVSTHRVHRHSTSLLDVPFRTATSPVPATTMMTWLCGLLLSSPLLTLLLSTPLSTCSSSRSTTSSPRFKLVRRRQCSSTPSAWTSLPSARQPP